MIDHIAIGVADLTASRAFYERALAPLGATLLMEFPEVLGFGRDGMPSFWVGAREVSGPAHIAFASPDRVTVAAFYEAALAAGGRDNGAPGPRPHYHQTYYGAFVLDLDGNNIEAVCHLPE